MNAKDGDALAVLTTQAAALAQSLADEEKQLVLNRPEEDESTLKSSDIKLWSGLFPRHISVRLAMLVLGFGGLSGQIPRNGLEGAKAAIVGVLFLGFILLLLSQTARLLSGWKLSLFVLFSLAASYFAQTFYTYAQPHIGFHLKDPFNPWYSGIKTLYGVYLASVISSLVMETSTRFDAQQGSDSKLRNSISVLNRDLEKLQEHQFATRFGTLQGKISGAIMGLQLARSQEELGNDGSQSKFFTQITKLLDEAIVEIDSLSLDTQRA